MKEWRKAEEYTNIRIGFSRPRSKWALISWAIRLIERTPYSHVYVEWEILDYRVHTVYQASGSKVNFMNHNIFREHHETLYLFDFEISEKKKHELVKWALMNVGTRYGMMQIVGIAYVKFMHMFGKRVRNPFGFGRTSQVCSELAGIVLKDFLGHEIQTDLDVVGPRGIFDFIRKIKKF